MMSKKKESMGRQRIPMVKIKKETHRQVTFSKRRAGLLSLSAIPASNPYWTVTCPETICP
ncbi:unnamed protein product [Brassica napus]|uniref:(rape) hypothetical protein n=1 Tax=Brassica napus TaxID=3708 RepID=A0A816PLF0_BRANA|nr:unnamed protein product [Brassica napus]